MVRYELQGGIIKPFWFPFASVYVPVTPCVLDGSLSFLEMVWKILKDLNKVAEATNNNHTDILMLAEQIEILFNTKLTYTEVTFTENDGTYTCDKTFAEIKEAFDNGIVIGRESGVNQFYIALGISGSGAGISRETIRFYSLDHETLCEFAVNDNSVTKSRIALITENGGTITGTLLLPDRDPVFPTEAASKQYVDAQDANNLQTAKDYADAQDAITLQAAKDYTDTGLAGKQDTLTFDTTPTDGSSNPVTSDGIYDALSGKQDTLTFDSTPTDGSSNPVTSDGIYDAIAAEHTYADNTFQIKNEFAIATRSQHGTDPTTITCNILFTTLIAYSQQNRVTVVKMTDDIDLAPANIHWFYFAGFEYDSREMPITAWFIGYNGKLSCNSLNEWSFTNW